MPRAQTAAVSVAVPIKALPCLAILTLCVSASLAQPITFGVKTGIPLTENFDAGSGLVSHAASSTYWSKTRRYTAGPTITFELTRRFGLEADALYRRLNYDRFDVAEYSLTDAGTVSQWASTAGSRLDVPVLLRWSPFGRVYAIAGPAFAIHYGFEERSHVVSDLRLAGFSEEYRSTSRPSELGSRVSKGVAFGFGFDCEWSRIHVKPEIRYSHWFSSAFVTDLHLRAVRNEATLLLGFEFGVKRAEGSRSSSARAVAANR